MDTIKIVNELRNSYLTVWAVPSGKEITDQYITNTIVQMVTNPVGTVAELVSAAKGLTVPFPVPGLRYRPMDKFQLSNNRLSTYPFASRAAIGESVMRDVVSFSAEYLIPQVPNDILPEELRDATRILYPASNLSQQLYALSNVIFKLTISDYLERLQYNGYTFMILTPFKIYKNCIFNTINGKLDSNGVSIISTGIEVVWTSVLVSPNAQSSPLQTSLAAFAT